MYPRRRRLAIILLTILPVIVFLIVAALYITFQVRSALGRLDVILVEELRIQTRRAVKVGRVDVSPLGTATIHDLRIANGETFERGTLLSAERVVIDYRWSDLVLGRVPAIQSVESVRLEKPTLLIERFRTGKLNIQDLLKPKPPPRRPPFIGVIDARDGTVIFRDWQARLSGPKPVVTQSVRVNGTFDAVNAPAYVYVATARSPKSLFGRMSLSGSMDSRRGRLSVDIRASNADASYWARYFVRPEAVTIRQGRGDLRLSATRRIVNGKRRWSYAGAATVRNGRVSIAGLRSPAANVRGTVSLANSIVTLNLSAMAANSPLRMTGVAVGLSKPKVDLRITSNQADFARILRAAQTPPSLRPVRVSGRGPLTLRIIGPSNDLVFVVRTSIPAAQGFGYSARNLDIRATYANDVVEIERASGRALNGQIAVEGAIELAGRSPRLALSGAASGVQLDLIPQIRNAGLRGVASGRFDLTGTAASPQLDARVQVSRGSLNKVVFRGVSGRVVVTQDRVRIRSLTAGTAGGVVRLAGTITPSRLDLRTVAVGVDLQKLLRPFNLAGYSGIANFQGRVTGPPSNPTIVGNAEIFEGRFQEYEFDYARGQLVATRASVSLENAVVRVLPAEITVRGRVAGLGTRAPRIELDLDVAEAPVDRILSILRVDAEITGALSGRLRVRGTSPNITAVGSLTLTDGSVAGYPVSSASADITYSNRTMRLTNLLAKSDGADFSAEGTIDRAGNLAFTFIANDIALARLADITRPYAVLSGTVDMSGKVTGTTDEPNLVASVVSDQPTINTVQIQRFAADVVWNGTAFTATDVLLRAAQGEFIIKRAAYDTESRALAVEGGSLQNFPFPPLYTLVAESPYVDAPEAEGIRNLLSRLRKPSRGTLTATFSASGPVDRLEGRVNLSAEDVDIAEIKDARIDLAAFARHGLVELESFEATASSLNVSARGTLIADGRTDLEVDAYNVDLADLTPATGPTHITGTATVRASVQGPIKSPVITASAEMVEPVIYGIKFDRLRASQIIVDQDSIDISRVLVTRDSHSGAFYGTVPWNWSTLGVPADRPIDLHASMEEQTLGILTVLSDMIVTDRTSGQLSANLDITGTLSNPNLAGRMTIADGKIGIRGIENDFTNLQGDLVFNGDVVRVERLSGASSAGGTFEVVPGGTLSVRNLISPVAGQPRGMADLAFRTDNLTIIERNLLGYREWVTARFTTGENGVTMVGPVTTPVIAGTVSVASASAILSPSARLGLAARGIYAFNPTFDLTFALGNDVWLRTPNLNAMLQGSGQLIGTLNRPNLQAGLTIAQGTLRLPTSRMRITRGTVNVSWTPEEGSRVVVDIRAQTSVTAASPTGARRRYTIVMTVQGPLENLQPENINLQSDPPGLSRERILAALGHFEDIYGNGELALRQQVSEIFTLAAPLVFAPLETAFIEALGLEEFNIEYGFEQPLAVFLSRKLFGDFYLSYWRIVTGAPTITGATYSLRLGYRVRDWLEFSYITDSRRVGILEAAYSRRF